MNNVKPFPPQVSQYRGNVSQAPRISMLRCDRDATSLQRLDQGGGEVADTAYLRRE
jgi:hypothetical protein